MKMYCILKNLRSEKGYKLSIDINQNLLNNIRVWCMNDRDKMKYYLAPKFIESINRDVWPEELTIHAVYYYQGIKHDISEKTVLNKILPDLSNIVLGIECDGYIPNDLSKNSINESVLLVSDGNVRETGKDIFEDPSGYFFYDEDPDFFDATEKYHTQEVDKNTEDSKPDKNSDICENEKCSNFNPSVDDNKNTSSDSSTLQKGKDDTVGNSVKQNNNYSEEYSATDRGINYNRTSRKKIVIIVSLIIAFIVVVTIVLLVIRNNMANIVVESQGDVRQTSNVDFKDLLSHETAEDIHDIYIKDFDGNGKVEAFATTKSPNGDGYDNLWYISEQGATLVAETGIVPQLLVVESGEILIPWRAGYGATLCYGLYHGQVKQLDIYKANIFQKEERGTIYVVEEYFNVNGEYHKNIACKFDPDSYELVMTDEFYESNPSEDTDFCWNRETPEVSDYQETNVSSQDEVLYSEDILFSDSDLYQIALTSISGTIQEWCYEDFDGDGEKEAFVTTGDDDAYYAEDGEKSLWYISDTGNVECIIDNEAYWYFNSEPFVFSDCKLLYLDARHGYYSILGIKTDSPVEVRMPEEESYYWISQDPESGIVTAADKGEERMHILEYDSTSLAFLDTGETVLND